MSLPDGRPRRISSGLERRDPYASPSVYYDDAEALRLEVLGHGNRALSSVSAAIGAIPFYGD